MGKKEFDKNWTNLAVRLKQLTGLDVNDSKHHISGTMQQARKNYERGEKLLGCAQAAYIKFLVDDLELIVMHDTKLIRILKNELMRCTIPESYFGIRMEIRIASSLISKKLRFEKSETPDFVVANGEKLGIECTSCFLQLGEEHEPKELVYKIQSAINKKTKKNYHTSPLVLVIDTSNLLYHEGKPTFPKLISDMDKIRPDLVETVEDSIFDSVLTFSYSWTPTLEGNGVTLHNVYARYDRTSIGLIALNFLNTHYPLGDYWLEGHHHEKV